MSRVTGKTFRRLLKCLQLVSAGEKVTYVCRHRREAARVHAKACDLLSCYGITDFKALKLHPSITLNHGGVVSFVSYEQIQSPGFAIDHGTIIMRDL